MLEQIFILQPNDAEAIRQFEERLLPPSGGDLLEREMATWHAKWRPEALNFYLPLGWSFGVKLGDEWRGYFLGQPFLFYRGLTQTLWVEHIAFTSESTGLQLIETAYKWARDKHLQTVIFSDGRNLDFARNQFPKLTVLADQSLELKSARF